MAFTVSIIEKTKVDVKDTNNAFIGQRVWGHATVLLDDYLEHYGLTLNASAFGLNSLISLFIQSVDVNGDYASANNDTVSFDWDPTTGTLMAYANDDGAAVADSGLDNMYIRVFFIGT
jgi:hypothetical protein